MSQCSPFDCLSFSQWIIVSRPLQKSFAQFENSNKKFVPFHFSISGPASASIAYISECHDDRRRGQAIMMTSIITAIACLFLPVMV